MPVQLICPNLRCRKMLSVPDEVRGRLVKCQHCQMMFRVPGMQTQKHARAWRGSRRPQKRNEPSSGDAQSKGGAPSRLGR